MGNQTGIGAKSRGRGPRPHGGVSVSVGKEVRGEADWSPGNIGKDFQIALKS